MNKSTYISIEGFLVEVVKETQPHQLHTPKKLPWLTYCKRCGLVALKNKASQKALKTGCVHEQERVLAKV